MGFSTVAAQILFFIAVVGISAGLIAVFGNYLDQAKGAMTDKQQYIVGQLRTDIVISNIDNSSGHLTIYAKNVGKEQMKTDCMNLYVDGSYVQLSAPMITDPSTGTPGNQVAYWPPEGTVRIIPSSATLIDGSVHEAKLVTCNGVTDTEDF
jgi:archaellum component FlaG (FlaF/FlaG flagellin family)